jgi:hypothetical protein
LNHFILVNLEPIHLKKIRKMNEYEKNEKLRELCSLGDLSLVKGFYEKERPDVNSKNKMNGW